MTDRYRQIANLPLAGEVIGRLGLPRPPVLRRHRPGDPAIASPVLLGAAPGGRLEGPVARLLAAAGGELRGPADDDGEQRYRALVFDATSIGSSGELRELHAFFHPAIRRLRSNGRMVVLGTPPQACAQPREAIAQRALEGFSRSLGKEARRGSTAQLVYVAPGAEDAIESTLRFLLSARSAYVSGQVVRIGALGGEPPPGVDSERPLADQVALVTGASRGIGAAIATVLARDGAHVVCLDVPALGGEVDAVARRLDGSSLTVDITDDDAPAAIAAALLEAHGGADVIVHNAGITRDRSLARMDAERWDAVLDVNLSSAERIDDELLAREAIRPRGRIVCVSSISGIAGNAGQANYATSKAGVIGRVQTMAPLLGERGQITINAVAPGFIETEMTARMPFALREAGRRMNSLTQGGLPVDVAETIAWFASPASTGVTGNVVRVCGQSLLGA